MAAVTITSPGDETKVVINSIGPLGNVATTASTPTPSTSPPVLSASTGSLPSATPVPTSTSTPAAAAGSSTPEVVLLPEDDSLDEKQLKRNKCINEIVTTERDYLRDLDFLNENFREPIKQRKLLKDNEFTEMFSNIMVLLNLNKQMFKDIQEQLIKCPSAPEIAPIFLSFSDFLKMYSSYCMNQAKALGKLKSISREMTHPEFREFLVQKYNTLETGVFTLRSYLIKPVQRVCKYPLFLRELMKWTPEDHPDFQKLDKAMKRIEEAVESIEQNTKSLENIEKIAEIQSRIEGGEKLGLVEPTRRFVREGPLKEIQVRGKEVVQSEDAYYYLFNDILVRTVSAAHSDSKKKFVRRVMANIGGRGKQSDEKFKMKGKLPVGDIVVADIDDGTIFEVKNVIQLCTQKEDERIYFVVPSSEEKSGWLADLNTVKHTAAPKS